MHAARQRSGDAFTAYRRLTRLLAWMQEHDFDELAASGLLRDVEEIVVESHRDLTEGQGQDWSPPMAYRWLRYEDPHPVQRLAEGVQKLRRKGGKLSAEAVDKACAKASEMGYLN